MRIEAVKEEQIEAIEANFTSSIEEVESIPYAANGPEDDLTAYTVLVPSSTLKRCRVSGLKIEHACSCDIIEVYLTGAHCLEKGYR